MLYTNLNDTLSLSYREKVMKFIISIIMPTTSAVWKYVKKTYEGDLKTFGKEL
jgi:hypothetical protein